MFCQAFGYVFRYYPLRWLEWFEEQRRAKPRRGGAGSCLRLPTHAGPASSPDFGMLLSSCWDSPGCVVAFCPGPSTAE